MTIGGLPRQALVDALRTAGVRTNDSAEVLLEHSAFDGASSLSMVVTTRTVGELEIAGAATLPRVYAAALDRGLQLCPAVTGPYLRLAMLDQVSAPDSVMSAGRAPTGSLTIAGELLSEDHDYPKGFYLRTVDGISWLRGYRCDDLHEFAQEDTFVFRAPAP